MTTKRTTYRGDKSERDLIRRAEELTGRKMPTRGEIARQLQDPNHVWDFNPNPSSPVRRAEVTTTPPSNVTTLDSARSAAPKVRRGWGGRFILPAAIASGAAGGAYAIHRSRRNKVRKLYDPFTGDTVEIGKAVSPMFGARNAFADQPTRKVGALVPTGKHVSHANKLERHTPLSGYRQQPTGRNAAKLGHYRKGRDLAARAYQGKTKKG